MSELTEQLDWFAAILWHTPMTEDEIRKHESFKNYSVDTILMMLDRLGKIYYRGNKVYVKKEAALKLGDHVNVTVYENCRKCKGTGTMKQYSGLGEANWPCDKCINGRILLRGE